MSTTDLFAAQHATPSSSPGQTECCPLGSDSKNQLRDSVCHLLQLPAEIRDQIYRMTLGGLTIVPRICSHDARRHSRGSCLPSMSYERWLSAKVDWLMVRTINENDTSNYRQISRLLRSLYATYHDDAWSSQARKYSCEGAKFFACHPGSTRVPQNVDNQLQNMAEKRQDALLPLELLLTCRQVYKEAALIPFEENAFRFKIGGPCEKILDTFLSRLKDFQKAAIRSISIFAGTTIYRRDFPFASLAALQSVRTLVLGYSLTDYNPDWTDLSEEDCKPIPAGLRTLKALPLDSVIVSIDRSAHLQKTSSERLPIYTPHVAEIATVAEHFLLAKYLPIATATPGKISYPERLTPVQLP